MVKFDQFLSSRLASYYANQHLLSYVVLLSLQEACQDYRCAKEYYSSLSEYVRSLLQVLVGMDEYLLGIDRHSLALQMLELEVFDPKLVDTQSVTRDARTCRLYRNLLFEYLTDRTRSGRHFLDGQKYATAALSCMKYLCDVVPYVFHNSFWVTNAYKTGTGHGSRRLYSIGPPLN